MAEMVKSLLNGEFELILPKHRADRPEWHTEKGWEKARLKSMSENIGKGDVVFYVGAEEGEFPALCELWGAKTVLFEPNDLVWSNIKAIWLANDIEMPLYCFSGFASNSNYREQEALSKNFPASADGPVISDHGFKELSDPGQIAQIRIDDLVQRTQVIPTIISLDVEGSEWEVLRGAEKVLREYKPKIYLSGHPEFLHYHFGEYLGDLRRWLMDLGYKETLLDYQHEVHLLYE